VRRLGFEFQFEYTDKSRYPDESRFGFAVYDSTYFIDYECDGDAWCSGCERQRERWSEVDSDVRQLRVRQFQSDDHDERG
jgi:hypothetical protein